MACHKSKLKLSVKPVIEKNIKLSESFSQVMENIKLPDSMFTEGSHFIFSHGDKILVLCDMKKYYNVNGRYVVMFDLQNGKLDFIDKEVRRMCPFKSKFAALERDTKNKSQGNAFYKLDLPDYKWISALFQPIPTSDIRFPDMLAYSSLLLVISGNLLQVYAFDLQQWFQFRLAIADGMIEASLTTTYAIMNDRLYICYADKTELYYIEMQEVNDIITPSQPTKHTVYLNLTCALYPVNYITTHEDYLVALFINTEDKHIRWAWYYSASCDHWHSITSCDPCIDGQWFTMENGKAAIAKLSAVWYFWYGWDINITIHQVELSID